MLAHGWAKTKAWFLPCFVILDCELVQQEYFSLNNSFALGSRGVPMRRFWIDLLGCYRFLHGPCFMLISVQDSTSWVVHHQFIKLTVLCWENPSGSASFPPRKGLSVVSIVDRFKIVSISHPCRVLSGFVPLQDFQIYASIVSGLCVSFSFLIPQDFPYLF